MKKTRALVLAAGKGTRMKSDIPKVLHKFSRKTIIENVVAALEINEIDEIGLVINKRIYPKIKDIFNTKVKYFFQENQFGTAHAVMSAENWLKEFNGNIVIVVGDAPLIDSKSIKNLINIQKTEKNSVTFLSAKFEKTPPYGRVIRNLDGNVVRIVEEKDASEEEKKIKEVSSSHYCFDNQKLQAALKLIQNKNAQNEFYLPDAIEIIAKTNRVNAIVVKEAITIKGINTQNELREMKKYSEEKKIREKITIKVPGRICLFGEHQDYLSLPVITCGINLKMKIEGKRIREKKFEIAMPDIDSKEVFKIPDNGEEITYSEERDYFKSAVNVLSRKGIKFPFGARCEITSKIPINSGTSSSTALVNAWITFLLEIGENVPEKLKDRESIAHLGYLTEVAEFSEPGGKMDQYATALGGIQKISFTEPVSIESFSQNLGCFILGDSKQAKNTKEILSKTKTKIISALKKIGRKISSFKDVSEVEKYKNQLSEREYSVLKGNVENMLLTKKAEKLLVEENFNHEKFGKLLSQEQRILDKNLDISTEKINKMIEIALKNGALGAKINGSGGGGCMFAYFPEEPKKLVKELEKLDCKAYVIEIGKGLTRS